MTFCKYTRRTNAYTHLPLVSAHTHTLLTCMRRARTVASRSQRTCGCVCMRTQGVFQWCGYPGGCSAYLESEGEGSLSLACHCCTFLQHGGEKVAIKKIIDVFATKTDARRILREIRILRHLDHANTVNVLEILVRPPTLPPTHPPSRPSPSGPARFQQFPQSLCGVRGDGYGHA